MTDGQTPQADPPNASRPAWPVPKAPVEAAPKSASGVPVTPGDPRFMTRDADGKLVNPDGSVYVPEEQPRTVHHVLADLASEVEGLWHSSPSGTESAVVRMRGHLRELRGLVDPKAAASRPV